MGDIKFLANLNQTSAEAVPRLSDVLGGERRLSFGSLAEYAGNVEAVEACLRFVRGCEPALALVGPSGWGKTHLLEVVTSLLERTQGVKTEVLSPQMLVSAAHRLDPTAPLILDNAHEIFERVRYKNEIRVILERRVRAGRPTLLAFTSHTVSRAMKGLLPNLDDWRITTIQEPNVGERRAVFSRLAEVADLEVFPDLAEIIGSYLVGNCCTFVGAVTRLRAEESSFAGPSGALRACGVLNPFFSDTPAWDLSRLILNRARKFAPLPDVRWLDLALFAMLHVAKLPEVEVAQASGLEPNVVYLRSLDFRKRFLASPELQSYVDAFCHDVVMRLKRGTTESLPATGIPGPGSS